MDLKHLRALLAVGEHHSFSGAARSLHTVQSNISAHIARLERELACTLVDRASNELTPEGQVVSARAQRIETELAALSADLAGLRDEVVGVVRIGIVGTTARWLVPGLLAELTTRHPRIRLTVLDGTSSVLVPQLVGGALDMAVITLPYQDPAIAVTPLFEEDRILVLPRDHPLAGRPSVTLAETAEFELLLDAPGTAFRSELDTYAAQHGVEFTAKAEIDGMRLLASLAFAGFGAAILPASAASGWAEDTWVAVAITDVSPRVIGVATRRLGLPSPVQRAAQECLISAIDSGGVEQPWLHPLAH